jgi:glutamate--cysteine ligase
MLGLRFAAVSPRRVGRIDREDPRAMTSQQPELSRETLLEYFLHGAVERSDWRVGMELEKLGRARSDGSAIPYDGRGPSVRKVLELIHDRRQGVPVYEADSLIGLDGPWGTISLEPGGQVEWSSRPMATLAELERSLQEHLEVMREASRRLELDWLDTAVDPDQPVEAMPWMPKARYKIMRRFLGERGRLAHRMMTQTASIQCAFDYADPQDWKRKFKAAVVLSPVATALFANSPRIDGKPTGYRSYRQRIWRETDPERCGLPDVVFEPRFDIEAWLDWVLAVPCIFRHRARGLVPAGAVPFRSLLELGGCDSVHPEDWELHASTIFTDVRSYTYIEVRNSDLQPDDQAFAVPCFWTGILYHDDSLAAAADLAACFDEATVWNEAMEIAARDGLEGKVRGRSLCDLAQGAIAIAASGLGNGAACVGDAAAPLRHLERLAARHGLKA